MKREKKKVLIFGATSQIAESLIEKLKNDSSEIYTVSRKMPENKSGLSKTLIADLAKEEEIDLAFKQIQNEKFDSIICFQGVAISSPVEYLSKDELQKQLDISLFSLLEILKRAKQVIDKNSTIINISSMASYGIFPFLSPYSISKASSDILLNLYEIETGIKTVSVKPGVVGTKFWKYSVNENEKNFERFKGEYYDAGQFLKTNALKNSTRGLSSEKAARLIYNIIYKKNPKASYLIGADSYFASFAANFKGRVLSRLINLVLKSRIMRSNNGK